MKTARTRRIAFWSVIAALVVTATAAAIMPKPVPVDLATVARGRLTVTLDHEGRTRVRDRYVVSAPLPGRVLRIDLRPGDPVVAGRTVLATFLPAASPLLDARTRAEAQARVKSAEAALSRVRAERDQARTERDFATEERERTRGLFAAGLATAQARQAAETAAVARQQQLEAAESAVRAAEHDVESARATLLEPAGSTARGTGAVRGAATRGVSAADGGATLTLRSPVDGVVLRRLRESEAVVLQGEPLLEVADVSALEVIADFLSTDAVRIQPGMPVLIDQWGGSAAIRGKVRCVEPSAFLKVSALGVEEQRVWVVIDFEEPRAARLALGDGYRVETRVVVFDRADAIVVPTSSLFRKGEGWAVFAFERGVARQRSVRIGQRNGMAAEVLSGLNPGDRVVVHPPDAAADGIRVVERSANP